MLKKAAPKARADITSTSSKSNIVRTYTTISRLRRTEEKTCGNVFVTSYIVDTYIQDAFTSSNGFLNTCSLVLSVKDVLDSGFVVTENFRKVAKHSDKKYAAFIKIAYIAYKFIVYKLFLTQFLVHSDHIVHMFIDYINLLLDYTIGK